MCSKNKGPFFKRSGEQAKTFGVLASKEQRSEEKHFRELERKVIFLSGSKELSPLSRASRMTQNFQAVHYLVHRAVPTVWYQYCG